MLNKTSSTKSSSVVTASGCASCGSYEVCVALIALALHTAGISLAASHQFRRSIMAAVPKRVAERLAAGLKRYQPILDAARARDVNESDTSMIVSDMLADI